MPRPVRKIFRRRKEDPQMACRLNTDEGNNQMKLGNEQKALFMYSKVSELPYIVIAFHAGSGTTFAHFFP